MVSSFFSSSSSPSPLAQIHSILLLLFGYNCQAFLLFFLAPRCLHGGQECIVPDLNDVDVENTLGGRDEAEVDQMGQRPHGPVDLHGRPELRADFAFNFVRLSVHQLHGTKEDGCKNRRPQKLIDSSFGSNRSSGGRCSGHDRLAIDISSVNAEKKKTEGTASILLSEDDCVGVQCKQCQQDRPHSVSEDCRRQIVAGEDKTYLIEKPVPVMPNRTMERHTKRRKFRRTLCIPWLAIHKRWRLCHQVSEYKSSQRLTPVSSGRNTPQTNGSKPSHENPIEPRRERKINPKIKKIVNCKHNTINRSHMLHDSPSLPHPSSRLQTIPSPTSPTFPTHLQLHLPLTSSSAAASTPALHYKQPKFQTYLTLSLSPSSPTIKKNKDDRSNTQHKLTPKYTQSLPHHPYDQFQITKHNSPLLPPQSCSRSSRSDHLHHAADRPPTSISSTTQSTSFLVYLSHRTNLNTVHTILLSSPPSFLFVPGNTNLSNIPKNKILPTSIVLRRRNPTPLHAETLGPSPSYS